MSENINQYPIIVKNVTKIYNLYEKPVDRLKESLHPLGKSYHKKFYALNDVSFKVGKREALGIIGNNGSGKSTLLKIITGVLTPTKGSVATQGEISALLELGAGFHPENTGIENVYINGAIHGFTRDEMDRKMDDILSFAEIGDFVHQPVRTYSSGMFVRLAFAVAIHVDPEILIVDEALSVGDIRFQQKCLRRIEEFKKEKTVLFVSHDLGAVNSFCDRAIWINEGKIMEEGTPEDVSKKYRAFMNDSSLKKVMVSGETLTSNPLIVENYDDIILEDQLLDQFGDNKAKITGVAFYDAISDEKIFMANPGQEIKLLIKGVANESIESPILGFTIKDRLGNIVLQSNSYVLDRHLPPLQKGQTILHGFQFTLPMLNVGEYTISPAIASGTQDNHLQHCWIHDALVFQILDQCKYRLEGYLVLPDVKFLQIM